MGLYFNSLYDAARPWIELSRVHKFAGSMLIVWPFAWSLTMSAFATSMPLAVFLAEFIYGVFWSALLHSVIVSGAGCIWNDILDRKLDAQVERTKNRPIASGRISVLGALGFLSIHLIVLVALLTLTNDLAWRLGLLTIFPLPGIYPLMKRITYWPQAWLGVAMNMVSLVTWSITRGTLSPAAFLLLSGCWSWTLYYDTIYACQDKRDDIKAGIKSTAVLFGTHVKSLLALFASLLLIFLGVSGALNGQNWIFFVISIGGAAIYLAHQVWTLDVNSVVECLRAFESNAFSVGFIVWLGMALDYALRLL